MESVSILATARSIGHCLSSLEKSIFAFGSYVPFPFNYVVPFVFYFIVMCTLFLFLTYLNIKFKCTTIKSSFATEDDMRMSKHVL